mmetsp:Transcript_13353/g.24072  ORF Transcript_13353/g.24072 Transcript_13353/m.24072 type:complete len:480 (-) Transcript_13353:83-1522(-)
MMSTCILTAALALGVLVQLEPTWGKPGEVCVGQACLAQETDEVALLQLSKAVAHRRKSTSVQPSQDTVANQKGNSSKTLENATISDVVHESAVVKVNTSSLHKTTKATTASAEEPEDERPPPNIMIVLAVAIALSIATWAMYYAGLLMCKNMPSESAAEFENVIDMTACFAGIIICFCSYGIAQEYIMTQLYGDEKFPSVPFLILCNRIFIVAVAIGLLIAKGEGIIWKPTMLVVFPGASSMASSWCQYECLHYVTFPTQVVFKSAKIVPTMIINTLVNFVWAPAGDYVQAIIITACVTGFSMLTEEASSSDGQSNTFKGIVELSIFLLGDALTSNGEKWVYTKYPTFSNTQMMFAMGVVGLIYSSVLVNFEHGGYPFMFGFLGRHPSCLIQIFALALCSMSGQYVIYYTVQKHGPVALAIMMTTRQILSIFISAALYGHVIPLSAILLAAVCFAVVLAKPLYKWYSKGGKSLKGKAES